MITLSDEAMATVDGTVTFAVRDELADTFVRLFPTDRRYWPEPFGAFRRFKSSRVPVDGTYNFRRIPAGEYYIVTAPAGDGDWMESRQLEALAKTATRTTVAAGEDKTIEVRR